MDPELAAGPLRDHLEGAPAAGRMLTHANGRWFRILATRLPGSSEGVVALHIADDTDLHLAAERLRQSELALRKSEVEYRSLFEQSALGVVVVSPEFVVARANPALLALLGAPSATDSVGRPPRIPGFPELEQAMRAALGGVSLTLEHAWVSTWGKPIRARVHLDPLRSASGVVIGAHVILQDTSEAHELQRQLLQAQKMHVLGELASGVAHDFNNYLAVILGYAEWLKEQQASDEVHQVGDEILAAATRSAALTRRLLAFSRREAPALAIVDAGEVVADLMRFLGRLVAPGIGLELVPAEGRMMVRVETPQLESALMNLVVNARDAMPNGGRIRLSVGRELLFAGDVCLPPASAPGPYVVLHVADSGQGMSDEVRARIFEPFFTTKPAGRGTGLGLPSVMHVVREAGGFLTVDSEVGVGTEFRIYLPEHREAVVSDVPVATGWTGRILVALPDAAVREQTCRCLGDAGHDVQGTRDGAEALTRFTAAERPFDLLVTDVVMPGISGAVLVERVRELRPGLPVLFATGTADPSITTDDRTGVLWKPVSPTELVAAVARLME